MTECMCSWKAVFAQKHDIFDVVPTQLLHCKQCEMTILSLPASLVKARRKYTSCAGGQQVRRSALQQADDVCLNLAQCICSVPLAILLKLVVRCISGITADSSKAVHDQEDLPAAGFSQLIAESTVG